MNRPEKKPSRPACLILGAAALAACLLFPVFSQDSGGGGGDFFFEEEEGLTVTAARESSQQMAVVEKDEISRSLAADLAGLLQQALGLNITRYGPYGNQAGVSIRGFDIKRVAILIDGAPAPLSNDGKFDINQIGLGSVERVEVIYGGSDSKYNVSGALGGVINIVTVKKQKRGLRLSAGVSNTSAMPGEYRSRGGETSPARFEDLADSQSFDFQAARGGQAYSFQANAFANRAGNHFLFTDYLDYVRRKDNNEVWDAGAGASVVRDLGAFAKLVFSGSGYYADKRVPSSGFSSVWGRQNDASLRLAVMLDAPRALLDSLSTEASVTYTASSRAYEPPSGAPSRHDQHGASFINRWAWYAGQKLTLRSGADYFFAHLDSSDLGVRERHDGGVYASAEYKAAEKLLVIPSLKAVFSSGDEGVTAVPKLGLAWDVTDGLTLKNNYFRSFKFPDFEELYWAGSGGFGNPDLRPEDGWGADLGASWRVKETLKFDSAFFAQWTRDSIHWYAKSGGIWRPENVGEAVFFGLENRLRFEIPFSRGPVEKIAPSLSYQYLLSYMLSYGYTFASGKRIPYSPEHTVAGAVDIFWKTGCLSLQGHYESGRYHDTANLTALAPCFLLDAVVSQKMGKTFTATGALRNILNTQYQSFYGYPMPGITLTLGIRAGFDMERGE